MDSDRGLFRSGHPREPHTVWRWQTPFAATCLVLSFGAAGCGDDDVVTPDASVPVDGSLADGGLPDAGPPPAGCNPLAMGGDCLLPFPSDVFRVEDADGARIEIPLDVLPASHQRSGVLPLDFLSRHPADGFSPLPGIMALFPEGVDDSALVFLTDDPATSQTTDSPTLIIDAETGELVPHFAELDPLAEEPSDQVLNIRPLVRLQHDRRYVVAIHSLPARDGGTVAAPDGFLEVLAGTADAELVARYEADIFPVVESAGVDRGALQAAWDFTVRTELDATRDMLDARAAALAVLDKNPPAVTVVEVIDEESEDIWRRIEGTITVPLVVDSAEPGAWLHRGADGRVTTNGTAEVPFRMLIPPSVGTAAPRDLPVRVIQFGHGFFGTRDEMLGDFLTKFINQHQMVAVGVDWWGMSANDRPALLDDVTGNIPDMFRFTDRVHQAMINQIALTRAVKTALLEVPETEVGGGAVIDPDQVYFYGISLGHILGGTYLALAPEIERGVLSVGGGGFGTMFFRASPFAAFRLILQAPLRTARAMQALASLAQSTMDRIDPAVYGPWVTSPPDFIEQSPAERRVLMHIGLGDASVPNLASWHHARSLGLPLLEPSPEPIYGLETVTTPHDGSALVVFDFGIAEPRPGTFADLNWPGNDVHEGVRRTAAGQAQANAFLAPDGLVIATCDGPCDPE